MRWLPPQQSSGNANSARPIYLFKVIMLGGNRSAFVVRPQVFHQISSFEELFFASSSVKIYVCMSIPLWPQFAACSGPRLPSRCLPHLGKVRWDAVWHLHRHPVRQLGAKGLLISQTWVCGIPRVTTRSQALRSPSCLRCFVPPGIAGSLSSRRCQRLYTLAQAKYVKALCIPWMPRFVFPSHIYKKKEAGKDGG